MPEITGVEAVRAKLQEFEERVAGAITAAKALARIKNDAGKLLGGIEENSAKADQALRKAENIRNQLQQLPG